MIYIYIYIYMHIYMDVSLSWPLYVLSVFVCVWDIQLES